VLRGARLEMRIFVQDQGVKKVNFRRVEKNVVLKGMSGFCRRV